MSAGALESALVVVVPEAEDLVGSFRDRHDPSAAEGIPAHVTLLYPFLPPDRIDRAVLDDLGRCFTGFAPFRYTLAATRRFASGVLYLEPAPAEPFRALTMAIWRRFPATPPYGGRRGDIVPHLTVAQIADPDALDRVAAAFERTAAARLPIAATASQAVLMDNRAGRWQVRDRFPLAAA